MGALTEQSAAGVVLHYVACAAALSRTTSFPLRSVTFALLCLKDLRRVPYQKPISELPPNHSSITNVIERISIAVNPSTHVRDMFGSNLSWHTGYPVCIFVVPLRPFMQVPVQYLE